MKRRLPIIILLVIMLFALISCTPKMKKGEAEELAANIIFNDLTVEYTGDEFEITFEGTLVDASTYHYFYNGKNQETPFKFKNVGNYSVKLIIENPNYNTYEKKIVFSIKQATPKITAPVASAIEYGQFLSDSELTGGVADVEGTFAWANPEIKPEIEKAREEGYEALFTPDDKLNYKTVSIKIKFEVEH